MFRKILVLTATSMLLGACGEPEVVACPAPKEIAEGVNLVHNCPIDGKHPTEPDQMLLGFAFAHPELRIVSSDFSPWAHVGYAFIYTTPKN